MLLLSERLKTSDASFSRETFPESCAWDAAVPVPTCSVAPASTRISSNAVAFWTASVPALTLSVPPARLSACAVPVLTTVPSPETTSCAVASASAGASTSVPVSETLIANCLSGSAMPPASVSAPSSTDIASEPERLTVPESVRFASPFLTKTPLPESVPA